MCRFCDELHEWKEIHKEGRSERQKEFKLRHYYKVCLCIKSFNKYGSAGTYIGRSHYLRYCPECGKKL